MTPRLGDGTVQPRLYLGTHRPNWLGQVDVPLFVSRRVLAARPARPPRRPEDMARYVRDLAKPVTLRKTLPRASAAWVLDSGGYTELAGRGEWSITAAQYAAEVGRCVDEIGMVEWAAPMDWMCEPSVVAKTGLSVAEHQRRTIRNYLALMDIGGPFVPVLQGWTISDYLRHADMYQQAGVCLTYEPVVAVGSVCRRGQDDEIVRILDRLSREGLRLHAFGVRSSALERAADCIVSADSMAWSYRARRDEPLPGHAHKSCANCREYALGWYIQQQVRLNHLRIGAAA